MRLGDHEQDADQHRGAQHDDGPEHPAPADGIGEQPAHQGSQHRRDAADRDHQRERPGRRTAGHHVGDDRPPDDHAPGAGEPLDEPGEDQHGERRGQRADDAGGHADRRADDQRAASSATVRERTHHQLTEGQAHEEGGQRELDRAGLGAEVGAELGEPRQVQVGRDGRERGQRREHEQQRPADRRDPRGRAGARARLRHRPSPPAARHTRNAPPAHGSDRPW